MPVEVNPKYTGDIDIYVDIPLPKGRTGTTKKSLPELTLDQVMTLYSEIGDFLRAEGKLTSMYNEKGVLQPEHWFTKAAGLNPEAKPFDRETIWVYGDRLSVTSPKDNQYQLVIEGEKMVWGANPPVAAKIEQLERNLEVQRTAYQSAIDRALTLRENLDTTVRQRDTAFADLARAQDAKAAAERKYESLKERVKAILEIS